MGKTNKIPQELDNISNIAIEFQPDALAIEKQKTPLASHILLWVIILFFLVIVLCTYYFEVDKIIIGHGKLITTAPKIVVKSLTHSIVKKVDVKVGDIVKEGTPLLTLDPTFSQADMDRLKQQIASRESQISRLEAELEEKDYLPSGKQEELEKVLFNKRREYYKFQIKSFENLISGFNSQYKNNESILNTLKTRVNVLLDLEGRNQQAIEKNAVSISSLLEARNKRLEIEGELKQIFRDTEQIPYEREKTEIQKNIFIQDWKQKITEELIKTKCEKNDLEEDLKKAVKLNQSNVIRATQDSIVLEIAPLSSESIVKEAEPLITLVPIGEDLEGEIEIEGQDIGLIKKSAEVRLKLDAFPFQRHGTLTGFITTISEDSFEKQAKEITRIVYRARISLGKENKLQKVPESFRLIPGMTLVGEIKVGTRKVIDYFLDPLIKALDESIKEP